MRLARPTENERLLRISAVHIGSSPRVEGLPRRPLTTAMNVSGETKILLKFGKRKSAVRCAPAIVCGVFFHNRCPNRFLLFF